MNFRHKRWVRIEYKKTADFIVIDDFGCLFLSRDDLTLLWYWS